MKHFTQDTIKVDFRKSEIVATVRVHQFKEGDFIIKYIPSLDISSYGETADEAEKMLSATIKEILTKMVLKGPTGTSAELRKYGFIPKKRIFADRKEYSHSTVDADGNLNGFEIPADAVSAPLTLSF